MKKGKLKELKKYEAALGDRKVYEMTPEELEAPITKEMGELCRHRLEKRWYRRLIELNILIVVIVVGMFIANFNKNMDTFREYGNQMVEEMKTEFNKVMEEAQEKASESGDDADDKSADADNDKAVDADNDKAVDADNDKVADTDSDKSADADSDKAADEDKAEMNLDDIPFEVKAFFYGAILLIVGYIALYFMYAQYRSMSLRITEKNFPEVYSTIENYARRLGIAVPKAYVMQTNGILNAFSTFLFRRQWIMIHSELFEVAYREHHDMDALNFVIAHEMAHIYYGHATLHYNLWIWFADRIPVIGAIASRAREYSCDRLAQRLTGTDGMDSMLVLVVDRHLYKMVAKEDYIEEMKKVKGFCVWGVNMVADHPIMSKRILALEAGKGSGDLY